MITIKIIPEFGILLQWKETYCIVNSDGHVQKNIVWKNKLVLDSSVIKRQLRFESDQDSPTVHGTMGFGQKSFRLVWRCHQLLSGFLANGHLPRMSCLSANDKEDNEVKQELCTDILHLPYD